MKRRSFFASLLAGATAQASPQPIRFDSRSFAASVGAVSPSAVNYNVLAGTTAEITNVGADANISYAPGWMKPRGAGRLHFFTHKENP